MRVVVLGLLLTLAACGTEGGGGMNPFPPDNGPAPLPPSGPVAYSCSDGTQLTVDIEGANARVAIVGGPSMVLPDAGGGLYSNGRYSFRGGGRDGQWAVGRAAAVTCRGS